MTQGVWVAGDSAVWEGGARASRPGASPAPRALPPAQLEEGGARPQAPALPRARPSTPDHGAGVLRAGRPGTALEVHMPGHFPSPAGTPGSLHFAELPSPGSLSASPLQVLRLTAPRIVTEHPLLARHHARGQGTTGHERQAGCGAVCVPSTLPRAQPGAEAQTLPPPSPPGLCTCCRMSLSHCLVWLTPTWLMSPPPGSLPGFLSHSGFTNCLLCPHSLPEKCFLRVCFPCALSAILIRPGARGGAIGVTSAPGQRMDTHHVRPHLCCGCALEAATVPKTQRGSLPSGGGSSEKGVSFPASVTPGRGRSSQRT